MELTLLHFYPDLMSLYGSYANIVLLKHHLEDLGNTVTVFPIRPGEDAKIADVDFIFMGAGTERSQKAALADFTRFGSELKKAAQAGTTMLFSGTAMELLGSTITDAAGKSYEGIGLADFTSVQGKKRLVGDVYGPTDLYDAAVVGFMNKCSVISHVELPLLTSCDMGFGNERENGPEGFFQNHVFASELTGPLLVKNPLMLKAVITAIYQKRGAVLPERLPEYPYEETGYAITAQQLKLRCEKK